MSEWRPAWPAILGETWWSALEDAAAELGGERVAFTFAGLDWESSLDFGTWRDLGARIAAGLTALGVEAGDRVAALGQGGPLWPLLQVACSRLGAILVPINSRYRHDEHVHVLGMARPKVAFAAVQVHTTATLDALRAAAVDAGLPLRTVAIDSPDLPLAIPAEAAPPAAEPPAPAPADAPLGWERFLALGAFAEDPVAGTADSPVLLQFTSGTTAFPKGALLTNANTLGAAYQLALRMGLDASDRFYSTQPFYHVGGSVATTLMPLVSGCRMIVPERYTAEETFRLIAKHRATARTGQAAMYWMELAHEDFSPATFESVVKGWAGGTPELRKLIVERMGIVGLTANYGLTEAAATTTVPPFDSPPEVRHETCGPVVADLEVGFALADGSVTTEREVEGEICVRGWSVMVGYHEDPEATAAAIDADGWLHTGDLGRLDADGNLLVVDRLKDMIKPGGENVSPAEVERVISTIDGVLQVAVVGRPDQRLGEVPVAFVQGRGEGDPSAAAIVDFCAAEMASFKVPRAVIFVEEWPLTASGKIRKQALRERLGGGPDPIVGATG